MKAKDRQLVSSTMLWAWSNNPRKAPKIGHKWTTCIDDRHKKKYLWATWVTEYSDGETTILEPAMIGYEREED